VSGVLAAPCNLIIVEAENYITSDFRQFQTFWIDSHQRFWLHHVVSAICLCFHEISKLLAGNLRKNRVSKAAPLMHFGKCLAN
jgi:hypothetical protein